MEKGTGEYDRISEIVKAIVVVMLSLIIALIVGVIIFRVFDIDEKYLGYFIRRFGAYLAFIYWFSYEFLFKSNKKNKMIKSITRFLIITLVFYLIFVLGPTKIGILKKMVLDIDVSLHYIGAVIIVLLCIIVVIIIYADKIIDNITNKSK